MARPKGYFTIAGPDREGLVRLAGTLNALTAPRRLLPPKLLKKAPPNLHADLSGLASLDLNGATYLLTLRESLRAQGFTLVYLGLPPRLIPIWNLAKENLLGEPSAPPPAPLGFFASVGKGLFAFAGDLRDQVSFLGEIISHLGGLILRPWTGRWGSVLNVANGSVVDALPVTCLVAFLVGLILAFQSAMLMQGFGVDIFVADLVGISIIRELGTLLTAIVLTGRSGSAFSSELASMKSNAEIDAFVTMGLSPGRDLALPRILALTLATPALTVLADLAGLLGGNLVMMSIGHPFRVFWDELALHVDLSDMATGLFKSLVFGFTVGVIGCQRGLYAAHGPSAVGEATTRGVVTNILAIAILDSLFAVLFYVLNW
ncbi:MAG: ABC transporter permease [Deltaproteobacteria bacterium]|nr:ABC transporter permease [Deltaproteobacteria bacterium]